MRTEIASLGEFGLIDRLTEGIKLENESSKYGVGDDAAVLSYPSEKQVLVTTDLLMEGVHLCHERHSPADYGISWPFQAFQRRRYGRALFRYSPGLPTI